MIRVFYNSKLFPTIIFVLIKDGQTNQVFKNDQVTTLLNDQEILGHNINIDPKQFTNLKDGYNQLTPKLLSQINQILAKHNIDVLVADFDDKFIVGEIIDIVPSNNLSICQVNIGEKALQIVCGATNARVGIKVIVASEGAILPNGKLITSSVIAGVRSDGMLCSSRELLLENVKEYKGIFELADSEILGSSISSLEWSKYESSK